MYIILQVVGGEKYFIYSVHDRLHILVAVRVSFNLKLKY